MNFSGCNKNSFCHSTCCLNGCLDKNKCWYDDHTNKWHDDNYIIKDTSIGYCKCDAGNNIIKINKNIGINDNNWNNTTCNTLCKTNIGCPEYDNIYAYSNYFIYPPDENKNIHKWHIKPQKDNYELFLLCHKKHNFELPDPIHLYLNY